MLTHWLPLPESVVFSSDVKPGPLESLVAVEALELPGVGIEPDHLVF